MKSFFKPEQTSVASVAVFSITIILTLFVGGIGAVFFQIHSSYAVNSADEEASLLADQLSVSLVPPIWNLDYEQIRNVVYSAMKDSNVVSISVQLKENTNQDYIISNYYIFSRNSNWEIVQKPDTSAMRDLTVQSRTIHNSGIDIGNVKITATRYFIRKEINQSIFILIISLILTVLIMNLSVYNLIWEIVLKPLRNLERIVQQDENLKPLKKHFYFREIAFLKKSIETMLALLKDRYNSLLENGNKLEAALKEKETLIRELYHRTKNNMQVITSMLSLRAHAAQDPLLKTAFLEMQNRIFSMALVHQKLYQSRNLSTISLKDYIEELSGLLVKSYRLSDRIDLVLNLEDVLVVIDTAIPCGLILNELISNSLKHAFPEETHGSIIIEMRKTGSWIEITVSDNGNTLPPDFDFRGNQSMGVQTVFLLGEGQLDGSIEYSTKNGVQCKIRFQDNLSAKRV